MPLVWRKKGEMTVLEGQRTGMLIVLIACLVIYGLSMFTIRRPNQGKPVPLSLQKHDSVVFELCGIEGEGIYFLPPAAESKDLIDAARIKETCYSEALPAVMIFRDARLTFFPGGKLQVGEISAAKRIALGVTLDVNSASAADLALVPGIGDSAASIIVQMRTEKGKFSSLLELMDVPGIKKKKLEKMKSFLSIDLGR
jgi:competence ComEA-like helix-hairpin-helix protein